MTRLYEAKPFIIAEVGSNWVSFEHAKDSIALAKKCGADAVKFQAFTTEALYGQGVMQGVKHPSTLPLDWLPKLKEKADAVGIEFMCTAFSPELVEAIDFYVEVHKVASSDLSYPQLLDAVAKTGKPVLLSTGASSKSDVDLALEHLDRKKTVLLYCNASYPSKHHNLFQLDTMRKTWGLPVGLSDHSIDVYTPLAAVVHHGAVVIEKHFTNVPELDMPDRGHSLDVTDFKLMCDAIRNGPNVEFQPSREERDMFLRHNRRLVTTKDIQPGEALVFGKNYGAYRTKEDDSHGLTPFLWNHKEWGPEGKAAKRKIEAGKGVGPGDF